jgi:hypothetical protein
MYVLADIKILDEDLRYEVIKERLYVYRLFVCCC